VKVPPRAMASAPMPVIRPGRKITRPCPTCGAPPFFSCRRLRPGKYNGQKEGEDGSYWVTVKYMHKER